MSQQSFTVRMRGRSFEDITDKVRASVRATGVRTGLCNLFLRHTSASLFICENADSSVRRDLERFMQQIAADGDPQYEHDTEGPDDMPSHIRSMLAGVSVSVPIYEGDLRLGTWQGIYLWEHRTAAHEREVVVTVVPA